jgi:hypothetical protein
MRAKPLARGVAATVLVFWICVLASCVLWLRGGTVERHPVKVADYPPYGAELRRLPPSSGHTEWGGTSPRGPGSYPVPSGKGAWVAVSLGPRGLGPFNILLGQVMDSAFVTTVALWNPARDETRPVVSIMEADPGSGASHAYSWSSDGRALLIYGSGGLPENYRSPVNLCVVYLPATDELFELNQCPPLS